MKLHYAHNLLGTGKTTVVVQILVQFLCRFPDAKILMTASTHNGSYAGTSFPDCTSV